MKVTNLSNIRLYFHDLRLTHASQVESRLGEDRYLGPGNYVYLPNTSEVIRSATKGDLRAWFEAGIIDLEDLDTLGASGSGTDTVVLTHDFGFPPIVYILKQVGSTWVDATGTVDVVHNNSFTTVTVTNTISSSQTLFIRLGT